MIQTAINSSSFIAGFILGVVLGSFASAVAILALIRHAAERGNWHSRDDSSW